MDGWSSQTSSNQIDEVISIAKRLFEQATTVTFTMTLMVALVHFTGLETIWTATGLGLSFDIVLGYLFLTVIVFVFLSFAHLISIATPLPAVVEVAD